MSMLELERVKVIQAVIERRLKRYQAAEHLGLSLRQMTRIVDRYRNFGAAGVPSRHRGKASNHQLPAGISGRAIALIREHYVDFGPTLACEKLYECHDIKLGKETVRRLMIEAGLWVPRRQRSAKVYQPRNRRSCLGELIQIDGSDHFWFEDRAPSCTLLVYVDDATSQLMALHFTATESTFSYFEATRKYLDKHGKPVAFYSDKASVFRVNAKDATSGKGHTQFARAMYELNIESICANTSQAKGRVERMNLTLQDRLVKELRLRGISTQQEANAFAPHFICDINARFAKPPRSDFNAHRGIRSDENLDHIFTWRELRKVSCNLTLQYDKILYLLPDNPEMRSLIRKYLEIVEYPDGHIEVWSNGTSVPYTIYDRLSEIDQSSIVENKRLSHVLRVAQTVQAKRDNRRNTHAPSRTHAGQPVKSKVKDKGLKKQRELNAADLNHAISVVNNLTQN